MNGKEGDLPIFECYTKRPITRQVGKRIYKYEAEE